MLTEDDDSQHGEKTKYANLAAALTCQLFLLNSATCEAIRFGEADEMMLPILGLHCREDKPWKRRTRRSRK
jgi:hypothetical protein